MAEGYKRLINKLEGFIKKYYRQQLLKGALLWLGVASFLFLIAAILELYGQFDSTVRTWLFYGFLLISVGLLGRYVLWPLSGLFKIKRNLSYAQVAKMIGKHIDKAGDQIQSALELHELNAQQSELLMASIEQKSKEIDAHSFTNLITYKEAYRFLYLLVVPVGLWLYFALSGRNSELLESSKRVVMFDKEFERIAPFEIEILNNELRVESGEDLELRLRFSGNEIPEEAYVESAMGISRLKRMDDGSFGFDFTNLSNDFAFSISALGFVKAGYVIDVVPVPVVKQLSMSVQPPSYTGVKRFVTNTKPILKVPEGSEITWQAEFKDAEVFIGLEDSLIGFAQESFKKEAYEGFDYQIKAKNEFVSKDITGKLRIDVIKDQSPNIQASIVNDSLYSQLFYFDVKASDDYGISQVKLMWKTDDQEIVELTNLKLNGLSVSESGVVNIDSLREVVGSGSLFFRAWDNDGVHGRKYADSKSFYLKKLTKEEKEESFQNGMGQSGEKLKEQKKELESAREKVSDISKSQDRESNSWQKKQEVQDLLKEIEKNIQEQRKEIQKQEKELMKVSVIAKNELLKKKAEDILDRDLDKQDKELQDLMKEVDKMMKDLDLKGLQRKMKDLDKKMEMRNTMQQSREALLKDLMFKRDMMKNALDMEELSKELKDLAKESNGKDEKEAQEKAEEKLDEIMKKQDELKEENEAYKNVEGHKQLEEMAEQLKEEMAETQKQLSKSNDQKANDSQQKSGNQSEEMSQQMQSMMSQMEANALEENIETLVQILENLELLSFGVESNMELIKEILRGDPSLKGRLIEQQRLSEGNRVIRDSLIALSQRAPEIKDYILEESERVREGLERATAELQEVKTAESAGHAQFAMLGANNLALMLDNSLRQMQQSLAQEQGSSANCNKPGGGSPKPSNASKMQGELGSKLDRMMQGSKEGEGQKEGKKEGDNGKGGQSGKNGQRGMNAKEIAEIMSQQEQLRNSIEQMESKEGGTKPGGNGLGEEMKKIEESLANLELEKARRQMAIVESRLLESEKAERKQSQKQERKSTAANELSQLYNKELERYLKEKQQVTESLKYKAVDFSQYYKGRSQEFLMID